MSKRRNEIVTTDWNYSGEMGHLQLAMMQDAALSLRTISSTLASILSRLDALGRDGLHQVIREHRAKLNREAKARAARRRNAKAAQS